MAMEKEVLFHLGEETYGIGIVHVKGIEKYTNIVPVPNAPEYIQGIINLRGDIIPIISMRVRFHLSKVQVTDETKLIIVKTQDVLIGIEVDKVKEIVEIPDSNISQPPAIIQNENTSYIDRIANINESLVLLLNLDGILSDKEQESIKQLLKEM
jgi:Chemotaxis signal transduction protein